MIQAPTASIDANLALGRHFFAEQDRLRGGPADALCAPEYRAALGGNPPIDRAAHEAFAQAFYAALPDMRHEVEDVIATDDRVVVRFIVHGTHTGAFYGIPPTQRPMTIAAHVILHVSNGKVTQLFGIFDEAGMLRQMGVLG